MAVHLSPSSLARILFSPFENPTSLPYVERNFIKLTGRWTLGAGIGALFFAILGSCLKQERALQASSLLCKVGILSGLTSAALLISFVHRLQSSSGEQLHHKTLRLEKRVAVLGIVVPAILNVGCRIWIKNKAAFTSLDKRYLCPLFAIGIAGNFLASYHIKQLRKCNFKFEDK